VQTQHQTGRFAVEGFGSLVAGVFGLLLVLVLGGDEVVFNGFAVEFGGRLEVEGRSTVVGVEVPTENCRLARFREGGQWTEGLLAKAAVRGCWPSG